MRAHSQRRLIWFLNVILGVGVVALVAWILLDVRKAVADPSFLRPKWAKQAVEDFKEQPPTNRSALRPPVSQKELDEIDRPEFKTPSRFHWIYSGPQPPAPPAPEEVAEERAPVEDDLSKLGRIAMLLFIGPREGQEVAEETVVYWEFSADKRKGFSPGEFIHAGADEPRGGIKLVDVKRRPDRERAFDVHYAVYDDAAGEPIKTGVYHYDGTIQLPDPVREKVLVTRAGGTAGTAEAPAEGRTESGVTGTSAPEPYVAPDNAREMVVWETPTRAKVEVDPTTFDWLRKSSPDDLAKSVKTQVARDESGKVIGIEIKGLSQGTPADRFDVKPGDILVSINGQPVKSRSDAMNIAQGLDPNIALVKVVVDRRGRLITFNIDPRDPKTRRRARALDNR